MNISMISRNKIVYVLSMMLGIFWGGMVDIPVYAQPSGSTSGEEKKAPAESTPPSTEQKTADTPAEKPSYGFFDLNSKTMTGDWGGVRTALSDVGIDIALAYQAHEWINLHGGRDTNQANRMSGTYDFVIKTDFKKLGLWDGGYGYIKAKGSWMESTGLNAGKVGALSRPNQDEREDDPIWIAKWWVGQKLWDGKIDIRLGRMEVNKDLFGLNAYANDEDTQFSNSWLVNSPNLPFTITMGAYMKIKPLDWFYFSMGALDADARGPKFGDIKTTFHGPAHFMGFWEWGFTPKFTWGNKEHPGNYRLGISYNGRFKQIIESSLGGIRRPRTDNNDAGFYLSFDQLVFKENADAKDTQGLGLFLRYAYARQEVNNLEHFWSMGGQYQGLIPERDQDVLGFGVAHGAYSDSFHDYRNQRSDSETVYELYYAIKLTPWLTLTPDLQYIDNPGGLGQLENDIVAGFRLRFIF